MDEPTKASLRGVQHLFNLPISGVLGLCCGPVQHPRYGELEKVLYAPQGRLRGLVHLPCRMEAQGPLCGAYGVSLALVGRGDDDAFRRPGHDVTTSAIVRSCTQSTPPYM